MSATTKDMKSELTRLEQESHRIAAETARLREALEDSRYIETKSADGETHVEIVGDDDWEFTGQRGTLRDLVSKLDVLQKVNDKVRIGPYPNAKTARSAQSQLSKAVEVLHWPRRANVTGTALETPYESHLKGDKSGQVWLYVRRTYAGESEHETH